MSNQLGTRQQQDAQNRVSDTQKSGGGVIYIRDIDLRELVPNIRIDDTDSQWKFHNRDVFQTIHDRLLLPESYVISRLVMLSHERMWGIVTISSDLPPVDQYHKFPRIEPLYAYVDGKPRLMRIETVTEPMSVPVAGGVSWLFKAL